MQKTILLFLFLGIASASSGSVMTTVYRADSNMLLEPIEVNIPIIKYPDIMVGTKLTIIVWSDVNEYWGDGFGNDGGSLAIEEEYWDYGVLLAREPKVDGDWSGSHLPAAGNEAVAWRWEEAGIDGFDLYTGSTGIESGNWFIIDYNATSVGTCKVGFYDHTISWYDPIYYLMFSHVRTRDFNGDTEVDFADFSILASYWWEVNCGDVNDCEGTDIDIDGSVDANDLILFTDYWLDRTK